MTNSASDNSWSAAQKYKNLKGSYYHELMAGGTPRIRLPMRLHEVDRIIDVQWEDLEGRKPIYWTVKPNRPIPKQVGRTKQYVNR